jgi:hypothetical protein
MHSCRFSGGGEADAMDMGESLDSERGVLGCSPLSNEAAVERTSETELDRAQEIEEMLSDGDYSVGACKLKL